MQITRSKTMKCAVSGFFVGMALAGCDRSGNAMRPAAPPEVAVVTVHPERLELTTELPGRTMACRVAEIRPQVNGIIQKRLFTEGSDVKAGDVLYQIDPAPFQAAVDNAEAHLAVARESVDRAHAALKASLSNVTRQQSTLKLARINRKRFEGAFKTNAVSGSERDRAVTEAEVAEAALKAAEAQVESDRKTISVAEATVKQAEAALETARINLGYTQVTAPIPGRIGRSNITDGALATAYQPVALATIQQLDPIYVDVPQSTAELLRLRRRFEEGRLNRDETSQRKVRLILEDGSPYPLEGTLESLDISVDPTTGSVILRTIFPNPEAVLLPSMFVRLVITEGINEQAILVPQQGISRTPKGEPYALIVDEQDTVQQRMLTIDRAIGNKWLVSSGLQDGDRIVVEGLQRIRPGASVRVVPFNGAHETGSPTATAVAPS